MSKLDWRFKALATCVSKDAARYHLNHIGFNHGKLYATDGHRLMVSKPEGLVNGYSLEDRLYSAGLIKKGGIAPIMDESRLIDWKQICGTIVGAKKIPIDIPAWLGNVKYKSSARSGHPIHITANGHITTDETDALIALNPEYISVLAGKDGLFCYIKDELSPMLFMDSSMDMDSADWFYVVMPLRMGKSKKKVGAA